MGKQYELYVQKGQPFWKVITNILFSHVGLLVLVLGYCVAGIFQTMLNQVYSAFLCVGAIIFQKIEEEREEEAHQAKIAATAVSSLFFI